MVQTIVSSVYSEVTEEYFFVDHPGLSCNGNVGVNFNHNITPSSSLNMHIFFFVQTSSIESILFLLGFTYVISLNLRRFVLNSPL